MLSIIAWRSRQSKNASRAVQHTLRALRLGASNAPSGEALGEVWEGGGEEEKRPMGGLVLKW